MDKKLDFVLNDELMDKIINNFNNLKPEIHKSIYDVYDEYNTHDKYSIEISIHKLK